MLLRAAELDAIRAAQIDLAFRRWDRPRLNVGTKMRTAIGLVEVTAVDEVALDAITDAEARRAGVASRDELVTRLDRHAERPVFRIGLRFAGPDPRVALREQAELTTADHAQIASRLDRLDAARPEPWTYPLLKLIEAEPGVRAADLAERTGRGRLAFKRDVRTLKELGLTESLETGYRLSPRGRAVLQATPL